MKATLKKLNVCACGFPALKDEITLGTEYDLEMNHLAAFTFICGGCHEHMMIVGVMVRPRLPGQRGGFLPLDLFMPLFKEELPAPDVFCGSRI